MQTIKTLLGFILFVINVSTASAQIVLKDAKDAPIPIAIQAFQKNLTNPEAEAAATDVEATFTADLIFSRMFKVIPAEAFLEPEITGPIEVLNVTSWRQVGAQFVIRARVSIEGPQAILEGYVFNITSGKTDLKKTYKWKKSDTDTLAHMFADDMVEIFTGKKGLFSTKIAFVYQPPKKRFKEIWLVDFNGKNLRPIVQNDRTNISPEWSADGKTLFFTSSSSVDWHLWKTDLSGKARQLTNFKGSALAPALLPNGREMVITLSKDGNPDLYLLDLEGHVKRRLTAKAGINIGPSPSPDGKQVCFSSDRFGNLHVFRLDIDTGETERLTRVGTLNDTCAWNPFEDQIIFSGMDVDREFDIFSMNSAGLNMERLTYDAKNNESPSWSPDGKLVTLASRRSGRNQIYVMRADGTQLAPIIDLPGEANQPAWSPRLGYR